ncbi:MAG: hypothetical protein IKC37_04940 [Clostridia bacterium]|nr:hypothetical protein [Clostridia bacterium]
MENKTLFGVMCIIFNHIGVPCFMQGRTKTGLMRILFGVITFGVVAVINIVKGIMLGIQVLKMSDEEFNAKKSTLDSGWPAHKDEE